MNLAKGNLIVNDIIIFRCDEYRNNNIQEYDGHVQTINEKGVDVIYLSGYKSQNDFIKWEDIIAKVDLSKPRIKLKNAPYSGNFLVFTPLKNIEQEKV